MTLYRETPCEHGRVQSHGAVPKWAGGTGISECPGGSREEVTIDYEAAARLGVVWASFTEKEKVRRIAYVKPFVDTALGVSEFNKERV